MIDGKEAVSFLGYDYFNSLIELNQLNKIKLSHEPSSEVICIFRLKKQIFTFSIDVPVGFTIIGL